MALYSKQLGELPAKSIADPIANNYTFYHSDILPGANYYRIKQVDRDKRSTYSPTILVISRSGLKETVIGPNPTHGQISIIQPDAAFLESYAIQTTAGIVVLRQTVQAQKDRIWSLDLNSLPPGGYVLTLFL